MRTELQKMLAGESYEAWDTELTTMRVKARQLLHEYNQLIAAPKEARAAVLYQLLGTASNADIQPPFYCDYGVHIKAGDNLFMNFNCVVLDCALVTIGNNVQMGPAVQIYAAFHPLVAAERIKGPELAGPITIGDNVWIGGGAIICPNVTIGSNTTIGAGSVVTRDIPANVFAAGNPCRVIKTIQ
ncbi:sugar O-acetyltransferase [Deminuibacter soli]|uniref:Acetyltransferase n=1 Tax=Deminuibacter soli TaxID=2291815 RepID=A0A3E1NDV6_9BACT|nr:sugar O-acetyltransferase [Deminuibacter soli]RFM26153.1 sugar O-acetyltransferase [Deminuibacter soli]